MKAWSLSHPQVIRMFFGVFLVLVLLEVIESHSVVKTLPGFVGDLPFTLETGYIGLGESDGEQLFYYFIESEGNPKDDPLMLWMTGGPDCSPISALLYEIGPLAFNYAASTLEKPVVEMVSHSWTKDDFFLYSNAWANRRDVRAALHIHEEFNTIEWVRCNESLHFYYDEEAISYTHDVLNTVDYHQHLSKKKCRALIYSGDHDMVVPYLSMLNWIRLLKLPVVDDWRPWSVNEQVAEYTMKYSKDDYNLTFATIKGGGHTAPAYKPKECLNMLMRWLADYNL